LAVTQTVKLFRKGRSQAVWLPKEFRFKGDQVFVKKVGNAVVLIPFHASWQTLFESLDQFSEESWRIEHSLCSRRSLSENEICNGQRPQFEPGEIDGLAGVF
jgi:antitoxin VapB